MMTKNDFLKSTSQRLRLEMLDLLFHNGGGHLGGSLSCLDLILYLYKYELNITDSNIADLNRDKFILSKGHASISLYQVLAEVGILKKSDLSNFGSFDSFLEGHPEMIKTRGVDFSTGSLGQGISLGIGMAIASNGKNNIWVLIGDGECQEGQIWESAMLASRFNLGNLFVILDENNFQELGWHYNSTYDTSPLPDSSNKWRSFGWDVVEVNGHDFLSIEDGLKKLKCKNNKPKIIIAKTIKGFGFNFIEENPLRFHCDQITILEYKQIRDQQYEIR